MREPRGVSDVRAASWEVGYGLGLQIFNEGGVRRYGHGGSMPGFLAGLLIDGDTGDGAVVMANATAGLSAAVNGELLAILAQEEPRPPRAWLPVPPPDGTLQALGVWYWGPSPYVLAARGDELELRTPLGPGRPSRFIRTGPDAYLGRDGYHAGEPLRLVRGPDGMVSHLDLGSFIYTRAPYDPGAPVPGGVDPGGWGA